MAIGLKTTPPTTDPPISARSAWPLLRWAPRSPRRRQHCPSNLPTLPSITRSNTLSPSRTRRARPFNRAGHRFPDIAALVSRSAVTGPKLPLTARVAVLCAATQYVIIRVRNFPREPGPIRTLQAQPSTIGLLAGIRRSVGHTCARANRECLPNAAGCGRAATSPRNSGASGECHACPATSTSACSWWHCLARDPRGRAGRAAAPANAASTPGGDTSAARADAHAGAGRGPAEPGV